MPGKHRSLLACATPEQTGQRSGHLSRRTRPIGGSLREQAQHQQLEARIDPDPAS
jgi:hypothetical protein